MHTQKDETSRLMHPEPVSVWKRSESFYVDKFRVMKYSPEEHRYFRRSNRNFYVTCTGIRNESTFYSL